MKITDAAIETIKLILKNIDGSDNKVTYYTDLFDYASKEIEPKDAAMLPNILLWDPMTKYSMSLFCPHCHQDEKVYNPSTVGCWNVYRKSTQPRLIWDRGWYCALVGKQYRCNKKHSIISYHPGFLSQIQDSRVPFILTHLTGATKTCYDLIIKLIENGSSFTNIQHFLEGLFVDSFERKRALFPPDTVPDIEKPLSFVPSDEMCKHYFITQHNLNKDAYQSQMDQISFTRLYVSTNNKSFDVNIGYRDSNNSRKWHKLFDNMFLVFNENGCVKAYGLTSGYSIEQVIKCLIALAPYNPETELISMEGYCCVSRESLREAFPNAAVTYGVSCAKDSLREHIAITDDKHEIIKDLNHVFQSPTNGTMVTGSENHLLRQLDAFTLKWTKEIDQGASSTSPLLAELFYNDVENLKSHVVNGCLSSIPHKTFQKEEVSIFKKLSSIFRARFIGVQVACALIAHHVYVYNCQRLGQSKHRPIWVHKPIQMSQEELMEEIIGDREETVEALANVVDVNDDDIDNVLTHDEQAINTENEIQGGNENQPKLSDECQQIIKLAELFRAINAYVGRLPITQRHKSTKSYLSVIIDIWDTHTYLMNCRAYRTNLEQTINIRMMGLKCVTSPNDQPSLAFSILAVLQELGNKERGAKSFSEFLSSKGICGQQDSALRNLQQLISKELVGENEAIYEHYLLLNKSSFKGTSSDHLSMIKAEIDIAMIHAASNVFGVSFMIIASCNEVPFLPVIPLNTIQACSPCFLMFDCESGVFSAMVTTEETNQTLPSQTKKFVSCTCGHRSTKLNSNKKKRKLTLRMCTINRCSCFSAGSKCTSLCVCKECGNGRPEMEEPPQNPVPPPPQPKKKFKRRARKYEFDVPSVGFVMQQEILSTSVGEEETVETNTEVIPASSMHHFFLDAIMFTLVSQQKFSDKAESNCDITKFMDSSLPELLHGIYLTIFDELQNLSIPQVGDGFLEYLVSMDESVVNNWTLETKVVYKWFKDLKELITLKKFEVIPQYENDDGEEDVEKPSEGVEIPPKGVKDRTAGGGKESEGSDKEQSLDIVNVNETS